TTATPWLVSWAELSRFATDGTAYTYTPYEVKAPNGYKASYSGDAANGFTVTNTYDGISSDDGDDTNDTLLTVNATKAWVYPSGVTAPADADKPAVSLELKRSDDALMGELTPVHTTTTPWLVSWTGLSRYATDGTAYTYTPYEVKAPNGYKASYSGDANTGFTVTNTYDGVSSDDGDDTNDTLLTVDATKAWVYPSGVTEPADADKPSVSLELKRSDDVLMGALTPAHTTTTPWLVSWAGLNRYATDGTAYTYTPYEVKAPNGYKASLSGSQETGFTISNTYDGVSSNDGDDTNDTLLTVNATKAWVYPSGVTEPEDADKPAVSLELKRSDDALMGELTPVHTTTTPWLVSWTGLSRYATDGTAYTYTPYEVKAPNGYATSVNGDQTTGFAVTNTYDGVSSDDGDDTNDTLLTVDATKAWVYPSGVTAPADADKPAVSLELKRSDDALMGEMTPVHTTATPWLVSWTGLSRYATDGTAYTYTPYEVKAPNGYKASYSGDATNGFTVTNTYDGVTDNTDPENPEETPVTVTVKKVWLDKGGNPLTAELPASLEISVTGGEETSSGSLNAAGNWSVQFKNLKKFSTTGNALAYAVSETVPNGYTQTSAIENPGHTFTLTNTYDGMTDNSDPDNPQETPVSIIVKKTWLDGEGSEVTDMTLLPSALSILVTGGEEPLTGALNFNENWRTQFTGLKKFSTTGLGFKYAVTETAPAGSSLIGNVQNPENTFTLTNQLNKEIADIHVHKIWENVESGNGLPAITLHLMRELDGVKSKVPDTDPLTLNPRETSGSWNAVNLLSPEGRTYTFSVREDVPNGYAVSYTGDAATGFTVMNTYDGVSSDDGDDTNDTLLTIDATKAWVYPSGVTAPADADKPAVSLELKRSDGVLMGEMTPAYTTATPWLVSWTGLSRYNTLGQAYSYTPYEVKAPNGYTPSVNGDQTTGFTVTNTYDGVSSDDGDDTNDTLLTVNATKAWVYPSGVTAPADADKPAVSLELKRSDDALMGELTPVHTAATPWLVSWTGLSRYATDGTAYTYTAYEVKAPNGYTTSVNGDQTTGFTVTNTYDGVSSDDGDDTNDTLLTVNATKAWSYPSGVTEPADADKPAVSLELKRSDDVLMGKRVPAHTTATPWLVSWTGLSRYDTLGQAYSYTPYEVKAPNGYKVSYSRDAATGFTVTNTYDGVSSDDGDDTNDTLLTVNATKAWVYPSGVTAPADADKPAVSLELKRSDNALMGALTPAHTTATPWQVSWTGLSRYATDGAAYTYTPYEVKTPNGYVASVVGSQETGLVITNTYDGMTDNTDPENPVKTPISVSVEKVWAGVPEGVETPESVHLVLARGDGVEMETLVLNAQHGWQGEWTGLRKYATDGSAFAYDLGEPSVPVGYTASTTGDKETGFTVTNTFQAQPDTMPSILLNMGDGFE
ncbi:MAG: Cna B-type domain-containing protein, partial [Clostridiales bacterium]|nr:Cna B-type domain-containing protein [Clostridiales bacterium]